MPKHITNIDELGIPEGGASSVDKLIKSQRCVTIEIRDDLWLKQNHSRLIRAIRGENLFINFTVLRHILGTKKYPYLDTEYASAPKLLPILDQKSEIFCQVRTMLDTANEMRFLFVNVDAENQPQWEQTYPQYFQSTPQFETIVSVFKISEVRLQMLRPNEILNHQ